MIVRMKEFRRLGAGAAGRIGLAVLYFNHEQARYMQSAGTSGFGFGKEVFLVGTGRFATSLAR